MPHGNIYIALCVINCCGCLLDWVSIDLLLPSIPRQQSRCNKSSKILFLRSVYCSYPCFYLWQTISHTCWPFGTHHPLQYCPCCFIFFYNTGLLPFEINMHFVSCISHCLLRVLQIFLQKYKLDWVCRGTWCRLNEWMCSDLLPEAMKFSWLLKTVIFGKYTKELNTYLQTQPNPLFSAWHSLRPDPRRSEPPTQNSRRQKSCFDWNCIACDGGIMPEAAQISFP